MLLIFIPIIFLIKHHLLIDKQKDHISIRFTVSLLFFLGRACQRKTSKIAITILSHSQLKLHILQNYKHSKSTYLAIFYSLTKILELYMKRPDFRKGKSTESKCIMTVVDHITQIPVEYHIHTMIISEYIKCGIT